MSMDSSSVRSHHDNLFPDSIGVRFSPMASPARPPSPLTLPDSSCRRLFSPLPVCSSRLGPDVGGGVSGNSKGGVEALVDEGTVSLLRASVGEVMDNFVCPITLSLPIDPVYISGDESGTTFDRESLMSHFLTRSRSGMSLTHPKTNLEIDVCAGGSIYDSICPDFRCLNILNGLWSRRETLGSENECVLSDWYKSRLRWRCEDLGDTSSCLVYASLYCTSESERMMYYSYGVHDMECTCSSTARCMFFYGRGLMEGRGCARNAVQGIHYLNAAAYRDDLLAMDYLSAYLSRGKFRSLSESDFWRVRASELRARGHG